MAAAQTKGHEEDGHTGMQEKKKKKKKKKEVCNDIMNFTDTWPGHAP